MVAPEGPGPSDRIDTCFFERGLHHVWVNPEAARQGVSNGFARSRKGGADSSGDLAFFARIETERRVRLHYQDCRVNPGPRMETAGRDGKMIDYLPVERGEYAERSVIA